MRNFFQLSGLAVWFLVSLPANAASLGYLWKSGQVQRYVFENTTHFKTESGIPEVDGILTVRSTFTEKVLAAPHEGTVEIELAIEKLEISVGGGPMRNLDLRSLGSRRFEGRADQSGRMALRQTVAIYPGEGQFHLGLKSVGNEPTSSGPLLVASFDPKTGTLAGAAKLSEKQKALAQRAMQQDPVANTLPVHLWELLTFPNGDQTAGHSVDVTYPTGPVHWSLASVEGPVATIRVTSGVTGKNAELLTAKMNADIISHFDTKVGQLLDVRGTVITRKSMKLSSRVLLRRL